MEMLKWSCGWIDDPQLASTRPLMNIGRIQAENLERVSTKRPWWGCALPLTDVSLVNARPPSGHSLQRRGASIRLPQLGLACPDLASLVWPIPACIVGCRSS